MDDLIRETLKKAYKESSDDIKMVIEDVIRKMEESAEKTDNIADDFFVMVLTFFIGRLGQ